MYAHIATGSRLGPHTLAYFLPETRSIIILFLEYAVIAPFGTPDRSWTPSLHYVTVQICTLDPWQKFVHGTRGSHFVGILGLGLRGPGPRW